MVAKKATAGSGRRSATIAKTQNAAAQKKPRAKTIPRKATKTAATVRKPASVAPQKKVVVTRTESPDFSKAMETLKRVRAKSDELDERISRLATNLA